MDFKMNAVIHRGNNYNNALRSFQHKRMEFLEQEIRVLDSETLWLLSVSYTHLTLPTICSV